MMSWRLEHTLSLSRVSSLSSRVPLNSFEFSLPLPFPFALKGFSVFLHWKWHNYLEILIIYRLCVWLRVWELHLNVINLHYLYIQLDWEGEGTSAVPGIQATFDCISINFTVFHNKFVLGRALIIWTLVNPRGRRNYDGCYCGCIFTLGRRTRGEREREWRGELVAKGN